MFKKPFRVKSNSQLKGSDKKKLRNEILQQFPGLSEDALNNILNNDEPIYQLKLLTHSGDIVIVHCVQKMPIVFEIEKIIYPTIYMLWYAPTLIHTFTTHPQVFPIIIGGADLMLPGVVLPNGVSLYAYGKLQKGDRVAINLTSNKAPIAVGNAANSSYDMYMSAKRGKCVRVLHYYGDFLCNYGTKLVIPDLGPAFETNIVHVPSLVEECKSESSNNIFKNFNNKINPNSDDGEQSMLPEDLTELISELKVENALGSNNSTELMDNLLKYCFLKAIRTTMRNVDLPLLTCNFYKLHMMPACPKGKTLELKNSSFKKLSNFLNEMVKLGAINVESLQKGVQCITKIDYSCELLKLFVDDISNEVTENNLVRDTSSTKIAAVPEINEKYFISPAVLPLFYKYDYKKEEAVPASIVSEVISDYVRVKNLQNPTNNKEVLIDDVLRRASNAPHKVKVVNWDQLVSNVFQQMVHSYKGEVGGCELPLIKGQPIDIKVERRSGNKKVTLVNNLELFGINLAEFSRECQRGVGASATINSLPFAKSAQLQIQGNQVIFVAKILTEKYQIPKRYLRGLENAPKKKK